MKAERRGLFLVVAVLLVSAVLGGIYGPNVRATTASADDYQSAVHDFTRRCREALTIQSPLDMNHTADVPEARLGQQALKPP